ncbi:hypothetical protein ACXR0O_02200 [Verrucomicrobiota bacterium sgz303538]
MAESSQPIAARSSGYGAVLAVVVASGIFTIFLTQASSPDYRKLFWNVVPFAVFHLLAAGIYFLLVHHWYRWIAFVVAAAVSLFLGEMVLRVWL